VATVLLIFLKISWPNGIAKWWSGNFRRWNGNFRWWNTRQFAECRSGLFRLNSITNVQSTDPQHDHAPNSNWAMSQV